MDAQLTLGFDGEPQARAAAKRASLTPRAREILQLFYQSPTRQATNSELLAVSSQYRSFIDELGYAGHDIQPGHRDKATGEVIYRLSNPPGGGR